MYTDESQEEYYPPLVLSLVWHWGRVSSIIKWIWEHVKHAEDKTQRWQVDQRCKTALSTHIGLIFGLMSLSRTCISLSQTCPICKMKSGWSKRLTEQSLKCSISALVGSVANKNGRHYYIFLQKNKQSHLYQVAEPNSQSLLGKGERLESAQ